MSAREPFVVGPVVTSWGVFHAATTPAGLAALTFPGQTPPGAVAATADLHLEIGRQLDNYFAGKRRRFDLPLDLRGTPFQLEVWRALQEIPYGATASYGDLARRLRCRGGSRAVGLANGRNPVPIVVPCHRVVGADGRLVGYDGGVDLKLRLLRLEGALL